jgi:formylglycine-generating enzyme required for sulfatase activity
MKKLLGRLSAGSCLMGWHAYAATQGTVSQSSRTAQKPKAKKVFSDCPSCPQMVVIPSGSFDMGSPASEIGRREDGDPVHQVNIGTFALSKTEITRGQFAAFVKETAYDIPNKCWTIEDGKYQERNGNWQKFGYLQDDKHPVACINWHDAVAYAKWLSRKTGKTYRLPTEAEWEYAARGKTSTARYWGENSDYACKYANVADKTTQKLIKRAASWKVHNCTDGFAYSAPVGSFKANAFGLNDMLGNVWEWVEDSYHENYQGAPVDGSAWKGDDKKRVLRGGSWYDAPRFVRTAGRDKAVPGSRYDNIGFRVARMLP